MHCHSDFLAIKPDQQEAVPDDSYSTVYSPVQNTKIGQHSDKRTPFHEYPRSQQRKFKSYRRVRSHKSTPVDHPDPDEVLRRGFLSYPFEPRWNPFFDRENSRSRHRISKLPQNFHGHFDESHFFSRPPFKFLNSHGGVDYVYLDAGLARDAARLRHRITEDLAVFA
ncbi:hypothetical protein Aduo_013410 [Ancylostoma duodenale]